MARDLKYYSPPTDLTALQRELQSKTSANEPAGAWDDDEDDTSDDWADDEPADVRRR